MLASCPPEETRASRPRDGARLPSPERPVLLLLTPCCWCCFRCAGGEGPRGGARSGGATGPERGGAAGSGPPAAAAAAVAAPDVLAPPVSCGGPAMSPNPSSASGARSTSSSRSASTIPSTCTCLAVLVGWGVCCGVCCGVCWALSRLLLPRCAPSPEGPRCWSWSLLLVGESGLERERSLPTRSSTLSAHMSTSFPPSTCSHSGYCTPKSSPAAGLLPALTYRVR